MSNNCVMDGFFRGEMIDGAIFKENMQKMSANPPWMSSQMTAQRGWNPYSFEGGSTAAISGEDFVVAASDTRMTQFDVNIMSRTAKKVHVLNDKIIINTAGFQGDVLQLNRVLEYRLHKFRFDYRHDMPVDFCAQMLSRTLYYKRFFPYYTGVVLAGLDEFGKGAVFSYDPIGCIERLPYACSGSAEPLLQPFLDNQVGHMTLSETAEKPKLTIERAISLVKDAFRFVAEREITTGDGLYLVVAQANKPIQISNVPLRED
ncbi:proteasome subunit domain-containing protein [Ditylenchus destructor]|nr:proteasome subunit domain-containing protein [Ditylenchus destructor]